MYLKIGTDDVLTFEEGLPTLEQLQKEVGGYLEAIFIHEPFPRATMYINEEGKQLGLPVNLYASYLAAQKLSYGSPLLGNCVLVGPPTPSGKDTSLSEAWKAHIMQMVTDLNKIKEAYRTIVGEVGE